MTPGIPAAWLLLLVFWLPDCSPLSGPSSVTGFVGGSLHVQCQYEEKYKTHDKYWCRPSLLVLCDAIVQTRPSGEARGGRVSIRDHPANLTFTVTMEQLTLEDAGAYKCSVDRRLALDESFQVEVSVLPATTAAHVTTAQTLATRALVPATVPTSPDPTMPTSTGAISKEGRHEHQTLSLPALLSTLAILLLLLAGASLLAWRMLRKPARADKHLEPSQSLRRATEASESQYVNLQLHTWPLQEEPVPSRQTEVEYSMVTLPMEEVTYSSVIFNSQKQDSDANGVPSQTPQAKEPEYSVIRKPF